GQDQIEADPRRCDREIRRGVGSAGTPGALQSAGSTPESQELGSRPFSGEESIVPVRGTGHGLACSIAVAGLALLFAVPSQAQDKTVELRLSHWVPTSHPLHKAIGDWGADIEKASGGTIKTKVFPAQQLGKAFDHYDMVRDGIADFAYVSTNYQPGRFPII